MKLSLVALLVLLSFTSISAQRLPEWYRVYSFEESKIEMNTDNLVIGGDIVRAKFRWTFDQPEPLVANSSVRFKSRLETIEFRCTDHLYRYYEVSVVGTTGTIIQSQLMSPPYRWQRIGFGSIIESLAKPACDLVAHRLDLDATDSARLAKEKSDKIDKFALSIKQTLERSRDFKNIVDSFFVSDFIERYLRDDDNWFYNLDHSTATRATPAELRKFYVALINAGYLTALYAISHTPSDDDQTIENKDVSEDELIPQDVHKLVDSHPYTLTYKTKAGGYDYLAENIDSLTRMRSYTDLLERVAILMRKHLADMKPEASTAENLLAAPYLKFRDCERQCLGLPKGTRIYEMTLSPIRVEFAEINGELKIISATDSSH